MVRITIGGPPGSGTSTICKMIEERTGFKYIYAGKIFREKAVELGLTLAEFSELCEREPGYDMELDRLMLEHALKDDIILEGRMIGPLCKRDRIKAFKVYIDAEVGIRAARVQERDGGEMGDVIRSMLDRERSEIGRYLEYYHLDPREALHYDLVIDSGNMTPEMEVERIMDEMERGH